MKRIALLGATGSIGKSALDVIARHPHRFRLVSVSAHRQVDELVALCRTFRPDRAVIADDACLPDLERALRDAQLPTQALGGTTALDAIASDASVDTVIAAIVGAAGLASTLAAARSGKQILLANKESVVMAGPLLVRAVAAGGARIIPLDSEHNAIFQCLPVPWENNPDQAGVLKVTLTASGGPFLGYSRERLQRVSPEQACAHPKWRMGRKISIDSATLMNKGLEVIEAHWLFGLPADRIEVVVHPQSLVHSLVAYRDGSLLAQLGHPDMRTALACALGHPERIDSGVPILNLAATGRLDFQAPDTDAFPCLELAYRALRAGGSAAVALNAANEVAVEAFLAGTLPFTGIPALVGAVLDKTDVRSISSLEDVLQSDAQARRDAREWVSHR